MLTNNKRIISKDDFISNNSKMTGLNNNDMIIGTSGSGKTRGYVIPNILNCNHSMIVSDTKGNLYNKLRPQLLKKGFKVINIDFKNISQSQYGYNPFDYIRYDEQTEKYNEQDISKISDILVPVENNKDPFWDYAAKQYICCMMGYVVSCLPKDEHNMTSVMKLLNIMYTSPEIFDKMIAELEEFEPNNMAVLKYNMFKSSRTADKMYSSIMGIISEKLDIFSYDTIVDFQEKTNRISFESFNKQKTILFLNISDTDRSMDKLISCFYTQALQRLCDIADANKKSQLDIPVRLILDDFATNCKIPNFDNIISVIRSREIYVSIILQNLSQLNSLYSESNAKTITNNCDHILYLGGQDSYTAEIMSDRINKTKSAIMMMPLKKAYLCQRGSNAKLVDMFDLSQLQLDL